MSDDQKAVYEALHQAQTADWEGLCRTTHQLKGALGSHGFDQLTPAATNLEQLLRAGGPADRVKNALEELIGLCRRVESGSD